MKRYCSLLLLFAVGCSVADGGSFLATSSPEKKQSRRVAVKEAEAPKKKTGEDPTPTPPIVLPYVSLPANMTAKIGGWIFLKAKTNCAHVIWEVYDPQNDLNVFPEEMLSNPFVTVLSSMVPGEYRIKAIAAQADQPVESDWCVITIQGAQPPPGPKPNPNPPDPPGPQPKPPAPVVTGPLQIIVIENYAGRTVAGASLDLKYWESVRKAGNTVYLMNTANPASLAEAQPYLVKAGNPKIPTVIFGTLNAQKQVVVVGVEAMPDVPLGTSANAVASLVQPTMTALITKYGGKVGIAR